MPLFLRRLPLRPVLLATLALWVAVALVVLGGAWAWEFWGTVPSEDLSAVRWVLLGGAGGLICSAGAVWLAFRRHLYELERLRAALLIASANPDGRLPPLPDEIGSTPDSPAHRLRVAAEILIARRLFPNATTDERLRAVLGAIDEGILVITEHGQISLVNTAAKGLLGAERVHLGASAFASLERAQLIGAIEQAKATQGAINWTLADVEGNHYAAKVAHLRGHSGTVIRLSLEDLQNRRSRGLVAAETAARPQLAVVAGTQTTLGGRAEAKGRQNGENRLAAPPALRCLSNEASLPSQAIGATLGNSTPSEWDLSLHDQPIPDILGDDAAPPLVTQATPLEDLPVLVFDAETTGLDVKGDRLVQVGGVRLHGRRIFHVATIDRLVNPQRHIPPQSTAIHGISDAMVSDADPFPLVWPSLEPLFRGAVVVGHNIGFDLAMIRRECALAGLPFVQPPSLDTVLLASLLLPEGTALTLDRVAVALGVDIHGRHTALGDALVTAEVYVRLLPLLEAAGVKTYGQAHAFTRQATHLLARQRAMGW